MKSVELCREVVKNRMDYVSWEATPPGITFEGNCGRIRLFKSTLTAMGEPEYVHFLFAPEDFMYAVEPCNADDMGAYRIIYNDRENNIVISCKALVLLVFKHCGWNEELSYRIAGEVYSPESQLIYFDLLRAYEIHEGRLLEVEE